jgi:hypothetical protein
MLRRLLLPIGLAVLVAGCSREPAQQKEDLPVTQASFEFGQKEDGGIKQTETIDVSPLGDGNIRYTLTLVTVATRMPSNRDERVMTDYVADEAGYVVRFFDKDKKFNSLGEAQEKGRLVHIWMPTASRKDGGELKLEGFPEALKVSGPVDWKQWKVWKAQLRGQQYLYDVNTGFLVGNIAGSDTWVLEQSTVPGLVP